MDLNADQAKVKACRARRAIILAGAGTGKTASATHHVASLIEEGVPAASILQITFTRKASQEMTHRVQALTQLDPAGEFPAIGTYHSIANALIRQNPRGFGFSRGAFTLLDKADAGHIMGLAFNAAGVKRGEVLKPSGIFDELSFCLNTGVDLKGRFEEVFEKEAPHAIEVVKNYSRLKREGSMADFEDLLVHWRNRMAYDAEYTKLLRSTWSHVIVDEFQDNNPLNFDILKRLNPDHLLVIGDKQQSIYGFRGANCKLIETFMTESPDAEIIRLEENYRSGQTILDLANEVVKSSTVALNLRSAMPTKAKVYARTFETDREEAAAAITWIEHCDNKGIPRDQIAFLARSTRTMVPLESRLKAAGITYRKYGGAHLSDSMEIRDLLALTRLAVNPQDTAAIRRLLVLFPKIGDKGAEKAALALTRDSSSAWPEQAANVPQWIESIRDAPSLDHGLRLAQGYLVPLFRGQKAYSSSLPARLDNVNQVIAAGVAVASSLAEFNDAFALSSDAGDGKHPAGAITISTIHSAKGLEWRSVWLYGTGDHQMPHPNARGQDEMEEEQRLMYVAVTRAKEDLLMSFPSKFGVFDQKPSPYLPSNLPWKTFMAPAVVHLPQVSHAYTPPGESGRQK